MGLDALLTHLHDETRSRAETVRSEAVERARALREAAAAEHARGLERGVAERERALASASRARLAEARHQASLGVLAARARLLARVRAAAERELERVAREAAYLARLADELTGALTLVPPPAVVCCPPALEPAMSAAVRALDGAPEALAIRPDPTCGAGFVLAAADGSVRVDATLTARLERAWPELSIELLGLVAETP